MKKPINLLLSTTLALSVITGCGASAPGNPTESSTENSTGSSTESPAESSTDNSTESSTDNSAENTAESSSDSSSDSAADSSSESSTEASTYDELITSLHAGQSYAYAPICDGEDALLITSYIFDDFDGHLATYEATIYMENNDSVEKITTVQSGGTAYPLAITEDNNLILLMHNSVAEGHVSKDTGKFIITEESAIDYQASEEGNYHNYKEGASELPTDSSIFDELSEKYESANILNFTKAGVSSDGVPQLSGAVYAAYKGEDLYNVSSYYIFDDETSGTTQTPDGVSGLPFTYEISGNEITFHYASEDDTSKGTFSWENGAFSTIEFPEDNETLSLSCLGNANPKTFDATKYYDNDNNLYMQVKKFDETSLTGDLYREERIKAEYVDNAETGSNIFSINGTQFSVVTFEEVNKELEYGTDDEFKNDVIGSTRFEKFLVKCSDDNFYYALEKEEYEDQYKVVAMMDEGILRKLVEENVTFTIKDNCEIILQKYVKGDAGDTSEQEYIIGREFKGDNYPDSSQGSDEYYVTSDMLVAISVVDGELYNFVQVYVP